MYAFGFTGIAASLALMLGGAYVAEYTDLNVLAIVLIVLGAVMLIPTIIYAMILEHAAGYYACKECGERFTVSIWKMTFAPHFGTTRYMRCPHCGKRGWQKKVMTKDCFCAILRTGKESAMWKKRKRCTAECPVCSLRSRVGR